MLVERPESPNGVDRPTSTFDSSGTERLKMTGLPPGDDGKVGTSPERTKEGAAETGSFCTKYAEFSWIGDGGGDKEDNGKWGLFGGRKSSTEMAGDSI